MHLHVCTVATRQNKGFDQLLESCKKKNISIDVLGFGQKFRGFSEKLILLKDYLRGLSDDDIVLFVDAYDVLILADEKSIVDTFLQMKAPFVISGDKGCFPFRELADQFPESPTSFRYLNSGGYIGYVNYVKALLQDLEPYQPEDDDQGLMSKHFLQHPEKYTIDHECRLFLTTATMIEKDLHIDRNEKSITCVETNSKPCIVHGNAWSLWYQFIHDQLFDIDWEDLAEGEEEKTVCLAILAQNSESTLEKYLQSIEKLRYNKRLITIYVHVVSSKDATLQILQKWVQKHQKQYRDIVFVESSLEERTEYFWIAQRYRIPASIREKSLQFAKETKCDYFLVIDCDNIVYPYTLKELQTYKKPIIAPLLQSMPDDNFTGNFYNEIQEDGTRKEDPDYLKIIRRSHKGIFEVPSIFGTYLIQASCLDSLSYLDETGDAPHIVFSRNARKHGIPQFICNERDFGFMIHFSDFLSQEQRAVLKEYFAH